MFWHLQESMLQNVKGQMKKAMASGAKELILNQMLGRQPNSAGKAVPTSWFLFPPAFPNYPPCSIFLHIFLFPGPWVGATSTLFSALACGHLSGVCTQENLQGCRPNFMSAAVSSLCR